MAMINHWGKWVDTEKPTTGVISLNAVVQFVSDEMYNGINLTAENAEKEYRQAHFEKYHHHPNSISMQKFWDQWEDQGDDNWIIGSWKKDSEGLYEPDESGEYAAIVREDVVQVVFSKYVTKVKSLCSPCYPGQADVNGGEDEQDSNFLAFNLPPEAYTMQEGIKMDNKYHCSQCGKPMSIMDYIIGSVCLKCCKENHAKAIGKSNKKQNKKGRIK